MSDPTTVTAAGSRAPGVQWQEVILPPPLPFLTGIPAFLGYARGAGPPGGERYDQPRLLTGWNQFEPLLGPAADTGYLAAAVRGFFENDGEACYVVRLRDEPVPPEEALASALGALTSFEAVDLICAPDIMRGLPLPPDAASLARVTGLQQQVLDHCRLRGDRFAILDGVLTDLVDTVDALPSAGAADQVSVAGQRSRLRGGQGALYHPWLLVADDQGHLVTVPPSGHVAGVYSRTDRQVGVHKAPANEVLAGVLDTRHHLGDDEAGRLHGLGVNGIRAFPGRGVRVWGARTLGTSSDPLMDQVSVRRLLTTVARWLEQFMAQLTYEPNDVLLWLRIMREVSAYCEDLFRRGALKGVTADEAFFVKCDSDTNPPAVIQAGQVVTEVGLAPIAPAEFVVVRVTHSDSGVSLSPIGPVA